MSLYAVVIVCGVVCAILISRLSKKPKSAPPGPYWALPMVGHLLQVAKYGLDSPTFALSELAKIYGDVYSLKLGSLNYVVLSSLESITSVLSKREVLSRPLIGTLADRNMNMNIGLAFSNGDFWNKKRTWIVRTLKDYGFGKSNSMGGSCVQEAKLIVDKFNQAIGPDGDEGILEVRNIFLLPVFKILWRMMMNRCTEDDEKVLKPLLKKSQDWFDATTFGPCPALLFPSLKYIAPERTGHAAQMSFYEEARQVANNLLHEMSFVKSESPESFVHAYFLEMKKDKKNFFEEDFYAVFMDLINGGSDTNNAFMEQILLYMILHPDVQQKVQTEIDNVISQEEDVTYSFSAQMPYTLATMLETHRVGRITPNYLPRITSERIHYKEFTIEKGTVVLANLRSAFSKRIFGEDVQNFRPERFLDEVTGQLNSLRWSVPGFGMGKRTCPGENLAQVTAFVFFVTILKNFKLRCIPNEPKPSSELLDGVTSMPHAYKLLVSHRKTTNNF